MIQDINAALLEMQGALLARSLRPGDEGIPRRQARAHELLTRALNERADVTLFCVEGRIIMDGSILPSCSALADTLFRMLQLNGIDQITFRRGIQADEINNLLDALAGRGEDENDMLAGGPHIGFGSLQAVNRVRDFANHRPSAIAYAEEAADVLPDIWRAILDNPVAHGRPYGDTVDVPARDDERLTATVACVSRVVEQGSATLLSLAPLRRHDEYTFVHTINVAILSTALGEAVGFDARTLHDLMIGALLHDIGKIELPADVLNKNGRFTEAERVMMQAHPVLGARALMDRPGVPELATIVAYEHHVRADRSGYPEVPRNWKLSQASRVVQLADVFDALRTHRPYRQGLPVPKIVEMMRQDVGFFDADLLEVFLAEVVARLIMENHGDPH